MNTPADPTRRNPPSANRAQVTAFKPSLSSAPANAALIPTKGIPFGRLAWRHKFVILAFVVLGAIGGVVNVTFTPPVYSASTMVELVAFNQNPGGSTQDRGDADTAAGMQTQLKILQSRTVLKRAVDRVNLDLAPVASVPPTPFAALRRRIPGFRQNAVVLNRDALYAAASSVTARILAPRLIEIQCQSTSPDMAAHFVNAVAAEHAAQAMANRSSSTQRNSQWVDSQLEEVKSNLQRANEKLRQFTQQSGADFIPDQATLADSKVKTLQSDLAGIQTDRISKQAKWELARTTPLENLPEVLQEPLLQAMKSKLTTLKLDLVALQATLTPEHYKVQRLQTQIAEVQHNFESETVLLRRRVESEYEEALRKERLLGGAYRTQTQVVASQADKVAQLALLKRDVDTQQLLYNNLLQQSSQAALVAMAPSVGIRVIDAAIPNRMASSPKPAKDISTWAVGGGAIGFGLILLRELARRKRLTELFDTPGHSQTILGVPELGVIPSTMLTPPRRRLLFGPSKMDESAEPVPNPALDAGQWQAEGSSLLSESFRQTLVSLLRNKPSSHKPVYVITSAGPGEGKTTLSANLARAMAEVGHRVLIVDADLRRPAVHALFGAKDHQGLSDILSSPKEIEDLDVDRFVQSTSVNNLYVMTHGTSREQSPAVLFFSPKLGALVSCLQERFDCVLFDTAPALPFPDARLWAKHADGVVLVVRSGVTTREEAGTACERFQHDGIAVLGTILNDWAPSDGGRLANYYYGYQAKSAS